MLAVKIFHDELLYALSEVDILLQHDAVHALCLLESELDVAGCHTVGSSPVCIPRVVGQSLSCELSATLAAHTCLHASHEVVAQFALYDVVICDSVG